MENEAGKYTKLADLTDVVGIRIITYFSNDVDRVSKIIEQEFDIDRANSIDKRAALDPDRFGYLSLHYIVSLEKNRAAFTENRKFASLRAEIQLRSILQHAWAEIEHDIGYKTELGLPRSIRRRFSRLAGLLELADGEFEGIRTDLSTYEAKVTQDIETTPESVSIDKASLSAFLQTNSVIAHLDQSIAKMCSAVLATEINSVVVEKDVAVLDFLGIHTIAALEKELRDNQGDILAFAHHWLTEKQDSVVRGVSMLYLTYVLTGRTGKADYVRQAAEVMGLGLSSTRKHLGDRVVSTSRKLSV